MYFKLLKIEIMKLLSDTFAKGIRKNKKSRAGKTPRPETQGPEQPDGANPFAAPQAEEQSLRTRGGAKTAAKTAGVIALAILIGASAMTMFIAIFISMAMSGLLETETAWVYFTVYGIIVVALCLISTIFIAKSAIFDSRDNEFVLSVPLKPSLILAVRVSMILVSEYIFELLVAIPAIGCVIIFSPGAVSALGYVLFAFGFLLLPLFAFAASLLLAWLITILMAKLPMKNLVAIVFAVGFYLLYFYFSFSGGFSKLAVIGENAANNADKLSSGIMYPLYLFANGVLSGNVKDWLVFAIIAVLPFAVVFTVLASTFTRILTMAKSERKKKYVARRLKSSGAFWSLVKKEVTRLVGKPMIVLNMVIGGMMAIIIAIVFIVNRDMVFGALTVFELETGIAIPIAALAVVAMVYVSSMCVASASQITLESKTMWILKSAPISVQEILKSKLMLQVFVATVPVLIGSGLVAAYSRAGLGEKLIIVLFPTVMTLLVGIVGLLFDLKFPKLQWTTEYQALKQNKATLYAMLLTWGYEGVSVLLYIFVFRRFAGLMTFLVGLFVVTVVLTGFLYRLLMVRGERWWLAIE
jgi:ABC-2 type transport system permease protein